MHYLSYCHSVLGANQVWIRRVLVWAGSWFVIGSLAYFVKPGLLTSIVSYMAEKFADIQDREGLVLAWWIFRNNLLAGTLTIFLGLILALVPLLSIAFNFFILGFLLASFLDAGQVFSFLVSVLPHGTIEIPALVIAGSLGLKLGFFW